MVRMTCGDVGDGIDRRTETFADPSGCGTGRMLLAGSNYSMRLYGMDIDYLCVLITKINLALYAPWFYVPESYFPPREEKSVAGVGTEISEIEPLPDSQKSEPTAATLFDLTEFSNESVKTKKKTTGKIYTTEIEQPSLFDFE